MVTSEAQLREQVFALRGQNPPVSFQKIADQLGVSKGIVYRLFHQPAKATAESNGNGAASVAVGGRAEYDDPVLTAAAARLEAKKLELQEKQLDRQLALLDGKSASGDAGMTMVLLDQMRRMTEDVDRKLAIQAAPAKPAEDPMQAMVRGMGMLAQIQDTAARLAPPPPVPASTSPADVELRVLLEKLNIETEASRARAASEAERNAFIFSAAKDNLPLIIAGIKSFFENQKRPPEAELPRLQVLPGGQTQVIDAPVAEILMTCSTCQAKSIVRPEPGELPLCPVCGGPLQEEGAQPKRAAAPIWPEDATFG